MASSVFYKFKSQKDFQRIEFDGTGISVFELKRDIIIKSGLGDGTDFDLTVTSEDGKEVYDDDTVIIPRSTSVLARRLPPMKPGAGRAARYMTGKVPVNAKNSSRKEQATSKSTVTAAPITNLNTQINENMTEEERMAAMFASQSEQWSAQKAEMASQTPVQFGGRPGAKKGPVANVPDHEPPVGYVCYRCGEKGHWIQVCPTNEDPTFDNKPKIKRTTGIPRSFLKAVEKPVAASNDGTEDDTKQPSGVMINADGEHVIAVPDAKSWEKFQAKTKQSAAALEAAALGNKELQDRGLECSLDQRIFLDPMKTPCCEKTYCNDCITNALIESDFTCPGCQTDGLLIDDLMPDVEMQSNITSYLAEKNTAAKAEKQRSKSPSVKAESPKEKVKSPISTPKSPSEVKLEKSKSPNPEGVVAAAAIKEEPKGTKRPAEDVLQNNPKIPKGPKAMQQQAAQKTLLQQQQAIMGNMNGFPNMPFMPPMPGMPNPFFGNNGFGGMPMPMMPGFGMNPMMNPMMQMPMGGFPAMNNMNAFNQFGGGVGSGMGMGNNMGMMNGMGRGGNMNGTGGGTAGVPTGPSGSFPNQQKTVFAEPLPNEEDNAYFRKPVNPHRHQGRQRKARPSDFRDV